MPFCHWFVILKLNKKHGLQPGYWVLLSPSLVFDLCVCLFTDRFKYSLLHFIHNLANPGDLLSQLIRKVNVLQIGLKWKISRSLDRIYLWQTVFPIGSPALKTCAVCCQALWRYNHFLLQVLCQLKKHTWLAHLFFVGVPCGLFI